MKIQIGYFASLALFVVCGCATMTEPKTPEVAIDDFMREYLGVQFGDDIAKINGYEDGVYLRKMENPFQYFNHAQCFYRKGKLYRINIWADIGKEYSQVSTEAQLKKSLSALAKKLNLPDTYFSTHWASHKCHYDNGILSWEGMSDCYQQNVGLTYFVKGGVMEWPNFRRYCIDIIDTELDRSLKSSRTKSPPYKPVTDDIRRNWGLPLPDAE